MDGTSPTRPRLLRAGLQQPQTAERARSPDSTRERDMSELTELHPGHAMLLRKLRSISPLTEDEKHCLLTLPLSTKSVGPDQDIVREGDRPSECCLVVEGFTCSYKFTVDGKRQIFS